MPDMTNRLFPLTRWTLCWDRSPRIPGNSSLIAVSLEGTRRPGSALAVLRSAALSAIALRVELKLSSCASESSVYNRIISLRGIASEGFGEL